MSFYVTTPIYYVNAQPHLGHAYTTIAADVLARHMRQRGEDVFFLTGTDEHGEPVADAARAQGLEPKELADRNAERFKALAPQLEASNDFFIRTSDPEHMAKVQEVLQRVHDNGHTYKGLYEGWYCPRCADFKVENEILEGNLCPIHEIPLTREQEENWFFRLSTFQQPLEQLYTEHPDFVMPTHHYNEARAFIAQGLQDVSLSRARMHWGVEVPWDRQHVFYVWFDALLNYYTALSYARPGADLTDRFWPATYHIIGKDILKFHTVFWPAMLIAADLAVPHHVFVHGFLLGADGRKMSKSLGNVLDPFEVMEQYGTDALRFYLMRDVAFGGDGAVGMDAVRTRYDAELANEYGNLASRTIAMIVRYRDGVIPTAPTDAGLREDFAQLSDGVASVLDRAEATQALELIWRRVRRLNRYVEEQAPWQLAKQPDAADQLDQTLVSLAEGVRVVSVLLHPVHAGHHRPPAGRARRRGHRLRRRRVRGAWQRCSGALAGAAVPETDVIDSHTHLGFCEPPAAELVAAAAQAGVTRIVTVGTDGASCRAALAAAEDFPQVYAAIGRHPNSATGFDAADLAELQALAAHEKCVAIGETGFDFYRDHATREDQERAFHGQIDLARQTGKPLVIHTRDADDATLATLTEHAGGVRVILHCFSMADRIEECVAQEDWWISFAGNLTYPKAQALREAALRVPLERLLVETDAPFLAPQPVRGKPNQPANVILTAQALAVERRISYEALDAAVQRSATAVFGW